MAEPQQVEETNDEIISSEEPEVKEEVKEEAKEEQTELKKNIEGVPVDKDGKRPSDNTIDFEKLKDILPEDVFNSVEKRFKSLYKQVKRQDAYLDTLHKDVYSKIEELSSKDKQKNKNVENLTSVVAELTTKDVTARNQLEVNELKTQLSQAYQDMDFDKVADLQVQIAQKAIQPAPKIEVPEIKEEAKAEVREEVKEEPLAAFSPREQVYLQEWINEMGDDGQLMRPWAQSYHPMYDYAFQQTAAMLRHPSLKNADLDTILGQVDAIMDAQLNPKTEATETAKEPKQVTPEPLTSDTNIRTKKNDNKVVLNRDQQLVAERLYSKLSTKEAHEKYRKSVAKLQSLGK
jgi:hypothetical protein